MTELKVALPELPLGREWQIKVDLPRIEVRLVSSFSGDVLASEWGYTQRRVALEDYIVHLARAVLNKYDLAKELTLTLGVRVSTR